jgi:hypothetical protein
MRAATQTLADVTAQLEAEFRRAVRHDPPWQRWAAHHHRLAGDEATLRRRLAGRGLDDRAALSALVALAAAGDQLAATLASLVVLPKMVAVERRNPRRYGGSYAALAGAVWEAIVATTRPDQHWLYEDIHKRAWKVVHRGCTPTPERTPFDLAAENTRPHADDVATGAASTVDLQRAFDRLNGHGLNAAGRELLEQIAAGTNEPIQRATPGSETARKRRYRLLTAMRNNPELHTALAS